MNATPGYENSPAVELVATHCAVCGRPLLDANSVETGIGPTCAKRGGFSAPALFPDWSGVRFALGEEEYATLEIDARRSLYNDSDVARLIANRLVYRVAAEQDGPRVQARVLALSALGYSKLATLIAERLGAVCVEAEGDVLVVTAPRSENFIQAMRKVPGSRWVGERRARLVPTSSRRALWAAIQSAFRGYLVVGKRLSIV